MTISVLSAADFSTFDDFPPNYLCELASESIIEVSGDDTLKYLQGQLTADLNRLSQEQALRTCHCDAKGKTLHIGLMAKWQDAMLLIGSSDSAKLSLAALKKFGVFSKVTIEEKQASLCLFAGKGQQVNAWIHHLFGQTPSHPMECVQSSHGGAICIGAEGHYLVWLSAALAQNALSEYADALVDESIWYAEQLLAGIPRLSTQTVEQFVPQMLNLQSVDAISFTKGCYMGQETVARAKYLGKNKRATYLLKADVAMAVQLNDKLQLLLGDNWKPTGNVINSVTLATQTWLLAVLPNDLNSDDTLSYQDIEFTLQPLPYELT